MRYHANSQLNRYIAVLTVAILPSAMLFSISTLNRLSEYPSGWAGFRTSRSISSLETWQQAQQLAADSFFVSGILLLILSTIVVLLALRRDYSYRKTSFIIGIIIGIQIMLLFAIILFINISL
jgi:hypothetical protein